MATLRFGQRTLNLPTSRLIRIPIGALLVIVGLFFGWLPILGYWMVPLGLLVLSIDIPTVRRWRRKMIVKLGAWLKRHYPGLAEKAGFNNGNGLPKGGVKRRS